MVKALCRTGRAAVGLFGKLPCAADFVRIHHDEAGGIAIDEWLTASVQALALARGSWPRETLRFVLDTGDAAQVLTGVVAPSCDRVGRRFPVAVYTALQTRSVVGQLPALCVLCDGFLAAAEEFVEAARSLERGMVERSLEQLPRPRLEGLRDAAASLREMLDGRTGGQFVDSAFGFGRRQHAAGALVRLVRASADAAGSHRKQAPVLSVSGADAADLWTFMALVERASGGHDRMQSVFWGKAPSGLRMLVSLGPPPPMLPQWWSDPARAGNRVLLVDGNDSRINEGILVAHADSTWERRGADFVSRIVQGSLGSPAR